MHDRWGTTYDRMKFRFSSPWESCVTKRHQRLPIVSYRSSFCAQMLHRKLLNNGPWILTYPHCFEILAPTSPVAGVRWLFRSNATRCPFVLRDDILVCFTEKEQNFQNDFEEFIWRLALLNLLFQGPNCNVTQLISKLRVFDWNLELWLTNVKSKRYTMFDFLTTHDANPIMNFPKKSSITSDL